MIVPALWLENRLIASMMAIGVLPLEIIWMLSFFSGGAMFHMTDDMFDTATPLYLRALSLFHLPLPAVILLLLYRLGYDKRALLAQICLTVTIFSVTYMTSKPMDNINWVFGFDRPQTMMPPLVYLAALVGGIIALVMIPMHVFLTRLQAKGIIHP